MGYISMRVLTILLNAALFASATTIAASGQETKAPSETRRIFSLTDGLMGNLHSNATLTELRKGDKVKSAELDVCHNVEKGSTHKDRFVVTLKPQGNSLVGSGQSQEGQLPVTVILNRKKTADGYSFSGSIKRGTTEYEIASDDNKDMSESELSDNQSSEEKIEQNPPNFAANAGQDIPDVAPNLIGVRVKREALASLVNELKKNGVKVHANGLMIGCAALRSGDQIVNLQVDPSRAITLVNNLKTLPGVLSVGWGGASVYTIHDAVRFQGTGQTSSDRDHLVSAIVAAEEESLGATRESTSWDPQTGELSVKLKRANQTIPQLGLTDHIQTTWLVSNESPKADNVLILWLGEVSVDIHDDGPDPRLALIQLSGRGEEGEDVDDESYPDSDKLITEVEHKVNGLIWDEDAKDWVKQRGQLDAGSEEHD
jgi:hypothetical protein